MVVNGILYGADKEERTMILDNINDARDDICHTMLLPVILCKMLTQADSNRIKLNAMELTKIEMRTNVSGLLEGESQKVSQWSNLLLGICTS